ncbi:hypothetical protein F5Y16DRAFT_395206 [Xylariaceae sp. FL0255]|nr:hypothetical protein F5Y16DRAFT_395206 [Xylariaceae sp. FL0255]
MRFYISAILASLVIGCHGLRLQHVMIELYQDNDCKVPVPGAGWTFVNEASCDDTVSTGWSSARMVFDTQDVPIRGDLTFYNKNYCALPQPHAHFDTASNYERCLNNFGFVANSVGFWAWP